MNIQWYPGHMTKAKRMMEESVKQVDCVIEIVDARCPLSSRNPDLAKISRGKKTLIVINKTDMADSAENERWKAYFEKNDLAAVLVNSVNGKGVEKLIGAIKEMMKEKALRDAERGLVNRPVRAMVCGIPNVGKSSFINKLCAKKSAKVGDRPGVTRGRQWITLPGGVELMDTPGILWPKFEDKEAAMNLAFIGSVNDDTVDIEELAANLLERLAKDYPALLEKRYSIDCGEPGGGFDLLEKVSRRRGFLLKGGECDTLRGANVILDEFRAAKIGRITLEKVEQNAEEK